MNFSYPLLYLSVLEFLFGSFFNNSYLLIGILDLVRHCSHVFLWIFAFDFIYLFFAIISLKYWYKKSLSVNAKFWILFKTCFLFYIFLFPLIIDHNVCLLFYLIMIHYFLDIVFQRPIEMEVNIIFTPEVKYSRQVVWLAKHFDSIQSVVKLNWSSVPAVVSFVLPPVSKVVKGYVSYVYERPLAPVENWSIGETWGYVSSF